MKMNKVKIIRSVIDGNDAMAVITLKPDGKKDQYDSSVSRR